MMLKKKYMHLITSWLDHCNVLFPGLPNTYVSECAIGAKMLQQDYWLQSPTPNVQITGLVPSYLLDLLAPYHPIRTLWSQGARYLVVLNIKRNTARSSVFSYRASLLWNRLHVSISEADTIKVLKATFKTFLFSQSHGWTTTLDHNQTSGDLTLTNTEAAFSTSISPTVSGGGNPTVNCSSQGTTHLSSLRV